MDQPQVDIKDHPIVDWALLIGRLIVGTIFLAHGSQKLFGAFGGYGIEAIAKNMGWIGYFVTTAEFFGGLGLILGFLSRFSAFWLIIEMTYAMLVVHWKNGFFLPGGFEFVLALIGLLAVVLLLGPGRFSLMRIILPRRVWPLE